MTKNRYLSHNFHLAEFINSPTATKLGIDNTPTRTVIRNLTKLCENVLQPVREAWGHPIIINSGYRCKELNKAVGGVWSSHHILGCAVDIRCYERKRNIELWNIIIDNAKSWTQLLFEDTDGDFSNPEWIHVSWIENDLRNDIGRIAINPTSKRRTYTNLKAEKDEDLNDD